MGLPIDHGEFPRLRDPEYRLKDELDNLGINAETGVTQWRGESIDWHLRLGICSIRPFPRDNGPGTGARYK